MIQIDRNTTDRLYQGDIIANVDYIEYAIEKNGEYEISKIIYPLVIVLSQDCDLLQDFRNKNDEEPSNQDKILFSALVAPLYNIEHVYTGEHLSKLDFKMQTIDKRKSKTENKFLKQNKNPRYHYLRFDESINVVDSIIDFKHFFTVNISYLERIKETSYIGKVSELYREDISQRFASFLSRIGLPD